MNFNLIKFISRSFTKSGKRQRFLSFARIIAFFSVFIGSMALIIAFSVLDGFDVKLHENAVKFTGHIIIKSFMGNEPLPNAKKAVNKIIRLKDVKQASPLIEREGLIRYKDFVDGIIIRSYKKEYDVTGIRENVVKGSFNFSSDTAREAVISKRMAEKMGASIGSSVILYSIDPKSTVEKFNPRIRKFTIKGIYETGLAQYDDLMIYIPYNEAESFFSMNKGDASLIVVTLHDMYNAPKSARDISAFIQYPYQPFTVFDYHQAIFAWIELQKAPIPIALGLISIVAALNIITMLLITVVEKTSTIGILRAIGMKGRDIISIFMFQGVALAFSGAAAGAFTGFLLCLIQDKFQIIRLKDKMYFLDSLPVHFELWHYAVVLAASLILAFLATLIPSYVALKIKPLRAIRFK